MDGDADEEDDAEWKDEHKTAQGLRAVWAYEHRNLLRSLHADGTLVTLGAELSQRFRVSSVEVRTLEQPPQILIPLRNYQLEGISFLDRAYDQGISAILGDEMGLGKTMQTIAYIAHLKYQRKFGGPHLVLCPVSVHSHWQDEFARACPELKVASLFSSAKSSVSKKIIEDYPDGYDVLVSTYGVASSVLLRGFFLNTWWRTLILDEGHVLKNERTRVAQTLRKFKFMQCVLLTGTPLQCNLHELWALLNFMYPDIFASSDAFDKTFQIGERKRKRGDDSEVLRRVQPSDDAEMLRKVHDLLAICMLRRLKSTAEVNLKDKVETLLVCPMSEVQTHWYRRVILSDPDLHMELKSADMETHFKTAGQSWQRLQGLLAGLRKVCNHPYLLPGIDPNPAVTDDAFVAASGKFQLLDRLLKRLKLAGHRCTIFSQFTTTLDMIARLLRLRDVPFCRLDGSMASDLRSGNIRDFNAAGSALEVFLLSTRAGGLGINLQSADTCILFDSDWNPQMDLQAMSRVHRIGQAKRVHVYRLVAGSSVEERILKRAERRLYLDRVVNHDSGARTMCQETMKASEWLDLITLQAAATVSGDTCGALTDEKLDAIIDRNREQGTTIEGVLKSGAVYSAADAKEALDEGQDYEDHKQEVAAQAREELDSLAKVRTALERRAAGTGESPPELEAAPQGLEHRAAGPEPAPQEHSAAGAGESPRELGLEHRPAGPEPAPQEHSTAGTGESPPELETLAASPAAAWRLSDDEA